MSRSSRSVQRMLLFCSGLALARFASATTYPATGGYYGPAYVDLTSATVTNDASNITFQINVNSSADLTQASQEYANYEVGFHTAATGSQGSTSLLTPYGNQIGISTGMDYFIGAYIYNGSAGAQLYQYNTSGQAFSLTGGFNTNFTPNITTALAANSLTVTVPMSLFGFSTGSQFNFDVWTTFGNPGGQGAYDALDNSNMTTQPYTPVVPYDSATAANSNFSNTVYTIAAPVTPVWQLDANGDYNTAANWAGGAVPNGPGAEADFLGAITAPRTISTAIPITLGTLVFNNSNSYTISGSGSLTFLTPSGNGAVNVLAGSHTINVPLTIISNTALNVSSGALLTLGGPVTINSGSSLYPIGAGTVNYNSSITLAPSASITFGNSIQSTGLFLNTSSAAYVASHGTNPTFLMQFGQLSFAGTTGSWLGTLDLNNNDMVVHGGNLANITSQVAEGFNGGNWNGSGGIISAEAAANPSHLTALGVILNTTDGTTPLYGSGTALGLFDGISPAADDVLVKHTYYGDANLDGTVDASDYSLIDNGYLQNLTGWYNGDFNYDGVINGSDYTLIDNAFNTQGASFSAEVAISTAQMASGAAVPEPTLGLLGIGVLSLLGRRRRS